MTVCGTFDLSYRKKKKKQCELIKDMVEGRGKFGCGPHKN